MPIATAVRRNHYLLLGAVVAVVFFVNLGGPPLWDRDEPRNAGCAAEMLAADNWSVPIFNAELRTHKPILLYWFIMAAYSALGVNEFAARLPSALLGAGTVFLTYAIGRRVYGASSGLWAGLILATTIMFGVASRAATPDATLIFCNTLAIALFVRGAFPREIGRTPDQFPQSFWVATSIYAAMGLGVLAKGPVGLVLPTAVIGMYLLVVRSPAFQMSAGEYAKHDTAAGGSWWNRAANLVWQTFEPRHFLKTCWHMRPVTAITTAAIVALPWYGLVTLRTNGVWTYEFFWQHNVTRAATTLEGHSGPPILFYLIAIMVGFFPWTVLTIPSGIHAARMCSSDDRQFRPATILFLCWIGVYVTLFSFAQTKLPSYVTPCYPAIALLVGAFLARWDNRQESAITIVKSGWGKFALANLLIVGCLIAVALPIVATLLLPGAQWLAVLGIPPLVGGIISWRLLSHDRHRATVRCLGLAATAFCLILLAVVPQEIGRHRKYGQLFQMTSNHSGPIASFGHLEPSWIFYGQRPIQSFEAVDKELLSQFLSKHPDALVITTSERVRELSESETILPDLAVLHTTEYFLRDLELVVLAGSKSSSLGKVARENLADQHGLR